MVPIPSCPSSLSPIPSHAIPSNPVQYRPTHVAPRHREPPHSLHPSSMPWLVKPISARIRAPAQTKMSLQRGASAARSSARLQRRKLNIWSACAKSSYCRQPGKEKQEEDGNIRYQSWQQVWTQSNIRHLYQSQHGRAHRLRWESLRSAWPGVRVCKTAVGPVSPRWRAKNSRRRWRRPYLRRLRYLWPRLLRGRSSAGPPLSNSLVLDLPDQSTKTSARCFGYCHNVNT